MMNCGVAEKFVERQGGWDWEGIGSLLDRGG